MTDPRNTQRFCPTCLSTDDELRAPAQLKVMAVAALALAARAQRAEDDLAELGRFLDRGLDAMEQRRRATEQFILAMQEAGLAAWLPELQQLREAWQLPDRIIRTTDMETAPQ